VRKPEGKRPQGIPRHIWEDNSKMDLRKIRWGSMDWIDLAQDRDQWRTLVNTAMSLWVPYDLGKFLSSLATSGFTRRAQLHAVSYLVSYTLIFSQSRHDGVDF
jgi:hypothetical protein